MINWEDLARALEQRGILSGEDLDRGLQANGLSLKKLDGEVFRQRGDLPGWLRQGKQLERMPLALPAFYFASKVIWPDSDLEAMGLTWLTWARTGLLSGFLGPLFAGQTRGRLVRLVENYLALDDLRLARGG